MKVDWTFQAFEDLNEISEFLEQNSPKYAEFIIDEILEKTRNLTQFPTMGRRVPEANIPNLRELIIRNYRVVYFVTSKEVIEIIAVRHSSRPLPESRSD